MAISLTAPRAQEASTGQLAQEPSSGTYQVTLLRASGGSSGGSGNSSSLTHSSSNSSGTGSLTSHFLFLLMFFGSAILFRLRLSHYSRNTRKLMKMLQREDSAWKYANLQKRVREIYFLVHKCWSEGDMRPAQQHISEDLFDNFTIKLNWMEFQHQRNARKRVRLLEAVPVAVHDNEDDTLDHVWFYIRGRMVDYITDTETGARLRGSPLPGSFGEYWQFQRNVNGHWVLNRILQKEEAAQIDFCE